jgi:hypothetical protein
LAPHCKKIILKMQGPKIQYPLIIPSPLQYIRKIFVRVSFFGRPKQPRLYSTVQRKRFALTTKIVDNFLNYFGRIRNGLNLFLVDL